MSNEVEITLKTRAELQGARQLEDQIQRDIGKAKALGQEYGELEKKLKQVQSVIAASKPAGPGLGDVFTKIREGLGDVIPGFAKLDGIMSKFAGGALGAVAAGFTLVAGAIAGAKHSLAEFAEAEEHVAKLDAALAQTGQLTDTYREKLQDLAQQMQEGTAISDDQWLAALTRLTQFGAKPESIEEYIETVKNLAGLLNGDVQQAAVIVARAIQGDYQQLARLGIHIDETKSKLDQWRQVAQEAASRGGGQLEAAGKTLNGQWKTLGLTLADLSKGVGRWISGTSVVQGTLLFLTDGFKSWADAIGGVVPKLEGLKNSAQPTIQTLAEAAASSSSFARALGEDAKQATAAADALNNYIDRLKDVQRLQDELEDAQMAEELAVVEDSGASGSEKTKRKGDIRQKYARQKFERGQETIKQEIKAREDAVNKAGGEVLGFDRAIDDTKQQKDYQQEIENTERLLRTKVAKTAEVNKAHQAAILDMGGIKEFLDRPTDVERAFGDKGRYEEQHAEEIEAKRKELEDAQRDEQKVRETLRALKGAPGLTDKTAAELQAEIDRLAKKRDDAFGRLGDAEKAMGGNEGLRNRLNYNERIYKTRTAADEIATSTEVRKSQGQEAETARQKEQASIKEAMQLHGIDGSRMATALDKNNALTSQVLGGLASKIEATNSVLQQIITELKNIKGRESSNRDR